MANPDRRLVPIVSLDVVGYSKLMFEHERQTVRLVQRLYDKLVAQTIGDFHGKIFKTMGDGVLAEFQSVVDAIEWTVQLQKTLHERKLKAPGGEMLQVRAGIVLADVLVNGEDLFGNGVTLAVRVQGHAPPGGVAITKWMHEYIAGRVEAEFTDIGPTSLKNIAKTVRLFVWHPDKVQVRAAPAQTATVSAPPSNRPSLVVLPFDNHSGEADQAYFADAVVEEITATLSRVRDFFVIARNSAFAYKGRSVDVRQVGRELGVRYAVEGSVRRVGERVRITAQLVDTESGNHVWSDKVDGAVSDLFELQDRVAAEVARAVQPSIRRAEVERARSKRPDTLAAYDLVMQAFPHLWAHRMTENPKAMALLDRALQLEPNYALAAALGAWARGQQVVYCWTDNVDREREEGRRLIEVASMNVGDEPTTLTALSTAMMQLGGDVREALAFGDRALKLDPNLSWGWMRKGFGHTYLIEPGEALAAFETATRLSPLDPFNFNVHVGMGLAQFAAGRPQEAIPFARRALAERPGLTWPYRDLAVYLAHAGELAAARDALERFTYLRPPVSLRSMGDTMRFMHPSLLARYLQGLKLAGLE